MPARQERTARACAAMKNLYGTPATAARNAVEQLLKVHHNNWDFIEDNNYSVVFEYTQEKIKDQNAKLKRKADNVLDLVQEFLVGGCLTRHNEERDQPSSVKGSRASNYRNAVNKAKQYDQNAKVHDQIIELCSDNDGPADILPKRCRKKIKEEPVGSYPCNRPKTSNSGTVKDKDKESEANDLQIQVHDRSGKIFRNIESRFDFDDELTEISVKRHETSDLAKRAAHLTDNVLSKNELKLYGKDQSQPLHESISVKHPNAVFRRDCPEISYEFGSSSGKNTNVKAEGLKSKPLDVRDECSDHNSETLKFDMASSDNGIVKISMLYNSSRKANLDTPNLIAVTKEIENKYRKIYGITDPDFSMMKLMKEICNCVWEIAAGYSKRVTETSNICNRSGGHNTNACHDKINENFCGETDEIVVNKHISNEPSNSSRLKAVMKYHRDHLLDISRGEEGVKIPLLNDNGATDRLPKFFYISKNIAFKDAYVNFSLARISDDNCCSQCVGDCLSSELPCACAGETRGEFAYSPGGLVKETFLNEAITMSRRPKRQHFYYCENCPLENNPLEKCKRKRPCRGHLMRKFIKECWNKCGCNKKCGNRVVQRGITASLQVFNTTEGKGWGLRSVNALQKGTFVCEYVGEIVTNHELHLRNTQRTGKEEHTYPVLLDADWGSERVLKDEEALCLDATKFGNCARFINHRCIDANLVEIPVEFETPDHHYYHLAFFTTRNIEPLEELTWDYGIQFDDKNHPIKAFNCKCGSKFCRDQQDSQI